MAPLLTVPTAFTSLAVPRVFSHSVRRDGSAAVP